MERKKRQNNELTKPLLITTDWFMTFPWLINKNRLHRILYIYIYIYI